MADFVQTEIGRDDLYYYVKTSSWYCALTKKYKFVNFGDFLWNVSAIAQWEWHCHGYGFWKCSRFSMQVTKHSVTEEWWYS